LKKEGAHLFSKKELHKLNTEQTRVGPERWGWYSVAVTVVLVVINLVIALASKSMVVGAEAFHNLVDLLTAIAILVGLKFATRKSSAFPYGLYKLENILAILLSLMIFFTAYEFVQDALANSMNESQVEPWMFGGLALVTIIPLLYSYFLLRAGKQANSPVLIATAKEFRTHVFTTGIVFVSLLAANVNFPLEKIGVVFIAIVIVKTAWELLADGVRSLLDASLSSEILEQIQGLILADPAVSAVSWISGRNAGRVRFVEAGVALRAANPEKLSIIPQRIETKIRENIPYIERVLIHPEASQSDSIRFAIPLKDKAGRISEHFSQAPYFVFINFSIDDLTFDVQQLVENQFSGEEKGRGILVAEWLVEKKVDVVVFPKEHQGKGPGYVLRDAGVAEQNIQSTTLIETLEEIRNTYLEQLKS
jgi:cation diffusion facilitator family transporter